MRTDSAVGLIGGLVYKPGWTLAARPSDRFENTVIVTVGYPAVSSNRDQAACGYPGKPMNLAPSFPLIIPAGCDDCGLYRQVLDTIRAVDSHEAREFLRVASTGWAPFHPHRQDGMLRWGDPRGDLVFGIA